MDLNDGSIFIPIRWPPTDRTMVIVSLQPIHDATMMKVVAARKATQVNVTSVFLQADGTLATRNHPQGMMVVVVEHNNLRNIDVIIFLVHHITYQMFVVPSTAELPDG